MRVAFSIAGPLGPRAAVQWADLEVIPRAGETVTLPGHGPELVRLVSWHPLGDEGAAAGSGFDEPHVYITLGHPRP